MTKPVLRVIEGGRDALYEEYLGWSCRFLNILLGISEGDEKDMDIARRKYRELMHRLERRFPDLKVVS